MSITITLPPSVAKLLIAEAEATGKDVSTLVAEAVEARLWLSRTSLRELLTPVHEEFRKSGMSEADLDSLLEEALAETRAERTSRTNSAK